MPPVLSRKRLRSDSPPAAPPTKRTRVRNPPARRSKDSVFQTLDAPPKVRRTLSQTKAFLAQQGDDSDLSEPESSDGDFEDVPLSRPTQSNSVSHGDGGGGDSEGDDWEDALDTPATASHMDGPEPVISGGVALTMSKYTTVAYDKTADGKKGPSKRQRQVRNATHCIHVQSLMFHNLMRNAWTQDNQVQKTLVSAMPHACWREVEQYWRDAGIQDGPVRAVFVPDKISKTTAASGKRKGQNWKNTGENGVLVFENSSAVQDKNKASKSCDRDRNARDWGAASEPLEPSVPNLSAGDPLMRLLRYLSAYWKSKFRVTAPSLRKRGYLSPMVLEAEVKAWQVNPNHPDIFGERIENLDAFREVARKCEGSRDVAHQLFTALLRGLGIQARMIVSLQPAGFGFSQAEEGKPKNLQKVAETSAQEARSLTKAPPKAEGKKSQRAATKDMPMVLDTTDDSDLSSVISISSDGDTGTATVRISKQRQSTDDLPYPTYWTEAISNLTHTPIAVSTHPRGLIASASLEDKLQDFYARGAAADKARQVLAYIIAFSYDGTAKDVTTRYLPKHQWPGRTKGFRFPVSKLPIHNKRGKVVEWEEWDWFHTMMHPYTRRHEKRLPWDEVEDEGDLVPAEPEKKRPMVDEGGKATLQGYKTSVEFVLERHLRREEALKPGAKIVRQFVTKKGNTEISEPVYRRRDIVNCKTVESWHKEGREIRESEQPLKFVPIRAVTVTRKREIEERQREDGVKPQQGLYARTQTDWIIPPPIVDGKIPRNAFNNIDIYVPTMVPKGAVHVPLKGTAKICRKLNIDHAEACTGFEFGKQRAVPVLTGVVVAAEYEDVVIGAWEEEEAVKAQKQAEKRVRLVLSLWKKFLSSLRIIERMRAEYGHQEELPPKREAVVAKRTPDQPKSQREIFDSQNDFEGGFFREEPARQQQNGNTVPAPDHDHVDMAEGFFAASQEDPVHGDLFIDHGENKAASRTPASTTTQQTPISLTSALMRPDEHDSIASLFDPPPPSEHETEINSNFRRAKKNGKSTSSRKRVAPVFIDSKDDEAAPEAHFDISTSQSIHSVPGRRAVCKNDAQVKSHYFAQGSDDETDLTDITDRMSPKKKAPAKRGRKSKAGKK